MESATQTTDYKVKDLSLADFGRKEIQISELEMPGLMALSYWVFHLDLHQSSHSHVHQLD